jgi:hypothetical protein
VLEREERKKGEYTEREREVGQQKEMKEMENGEIYLRDKKVKKRSI